MLLIMLLVKKEKSRAKKDRSVEKKGTSKNYAMCQFRNQSKNNTNNIIEKETNKNLYLTGKKR